jgi:putative ABC transport system permease protein
MASFLDDVLYAFRQLRKTPGFTAVSVVTLALGIGANTAIFSLTDQILLRLLPVSHPEELVVLRSPGETRGHTWSDGLEGGTFSYPMYKDLRDRNQVFSGLIARYPLSLNVAGQGETERVAGELVSGNYFQVLGVNPVLGRVFTSEDETAPGANAVAVLSYGYWARHFGSSLSMLNQQLVVNGSLLTVVGVTRPGFSGVEIGQVPDIFVPITMKAQMTPNWNGLEDRNDRWVAIFGRVKPGLSTPQAQSGVQPLYHALLEFEWPLSKSLPADRERFVGRPLLLDPGARGRPIVQLDAKKPLFFLTAMVGLILLIACANLASLLIVRGEARQREVAVRLSLGASERRILRQLFTETLMLTAAGGALGIGLASWTIKILVTSLARSAAVVGLKAGLDYRVLSFAIAASVGASLLFGLAPAFRSARVDLHGALKEQGSSLSGTRTNVRLRKSLIVCQVGLTASLLAGAGLFTHSLVNLKQLSLGIRTDHAIEFSIAPGLNRYTTARTVALCDRLQETIARLPGVGSVSAARIPVLTDSDAGADVTVEGYIPAADEELHFFENWVGPNYFETLGIPLASGREFRASDGPDSPKVAIINRTAARRYFAHRNPVGLHLGFFGIAGVFGAGNSLHPDIEIVGVVEDSKHTSVRGPIHPFVYMPYAQDKSLSHVTFYVRTALDPAAMSRTLRTAVAELDPALPVYDLRTLDQQLDDSLFADRLVTALSLCLGALACLLAAIGLYGVMAYLVTRRTREIGVRIALGATRENIAWLVLREGLLLLLAGLAIGLALAALAGHLIESELFGVKASDPLVFASVIGLLSVIGLVAGGLPARKAATLEPMNALRCE